MQSGYNPKALDLLKKTFESVTGLSPEGTLDANEIEETEAGSLRYRFAGSRTRPSVTILVMGGVKKFISMALSSDASRILHHACAQA